MSEHTKGEWELTDVHNFTGTFVVWLKCDGKRILTLRETENYTTKEQFVANARLIAAAPKTAEHRDKLLKERDDLLDACEKSSNLLIKERPYAECYRKVCERLGIKQNILGYVEGITEHRDKLLAVCGRGLALIKIDAKFIKKYIATDGKELSKDLSEKVQGIINEMKAAIAGSKAMKKLTLDQTWKLCLDLWKWVAEQWASGRRGVVSLKDEWFEQHGYKINEIHENCFFCHAAPSNCPDCPGRKVDEDFDCHGIWDFDPIAFYNNLVSLNRKRLAKKKK